MFAGVTLTKAAVPAHHGPPIDLLFGRLPSSENCFFDGHSKGWNRAGGGAGDGRGGTKAPAAESDAGGGSGGGSATIF